MKLIPLTNYMAMMRRCINGTSFSFVDTSGQTRNVYSNTSANPWYLNYSGTATSPQTAIYFAYGSSAETISYNTTTIPDQVTTSGTASFTSNSTGWILNLRIVGTAEATVRHLVLVRSIYYGSSNTSPAVVMAIKLDTPITLDSSNNYTADFALSAAALAPAT